MNARTILADGGIETALESRLHQEFPEFAAFVLLGSEDGRTALREYYAPFAELAVREGMPLIVDTPTWRANPDWGAILGYGEAGLNDVNTDAVSFVREVVEAQLAAAGLEEAEDQDILVNGCVGPRSDDYVAGDRMSPSEAEAYHGPQVRALADAGADRVTSITTLDAAEGIGVVRAAVAARVPVAVSFVVGANGRLADGSSLAEAIAEVDAATDGAALGFLVNCAHPREVAAGLAPDAGEEELLRILGFRLNAAASTDSDAGEAGAIDGPDTFAHLELGLRRLAPAATVFGGCCGTDVPHIQAIARLSGTR